jgi:hypothetical protein
LPLGAACAVTDSMYRVGAWKKRVRLRGSGG